MNPHRILSKLLFIVILISIAYLSFGQSWSGTWKQKGGTLEFGIEMHLVKDKENGVWGVMSWTVKKPNTRSEKSVKYYKDKIGKSALLFVGGEFDPQTNKYTIRPNEEEDPVGFLSAGGSYIFTSRKGKLTGKSLSSRYGNSITGYFNGVTTERKSNEILKSAGFDLNDIEIAKFNVGDVNEDGSFNPGEQGYLYYAVKNVGNTFNIPKWINFFPTFSTDNFEVIGKPNHLFHEPLEPQEENPAYLFRFRRDSSDLSKPEANISIELGFLDDYRRTLSTEVVALKDGPVEYTAFPQSPDFTLDEFPGLYIGIKDDRLLNFRKDGTFSMRLSDNSTVDGNWAIEGGIEDAFARRDSVIEVAKYNRLELSNFSPYQGDDDIQLFTDTKPRYRYLRTRDFEKNGLLEIKDGKHYYSFFRLGVVSPQDEMVKKIKHAVLGTWSQQMKYSMHYYKFQEDNTVLYADEFRKGTDAGEWMIALDDNPDGEKRYFVIMRKFEHATVRKYLISTADMGPDRMLVFNDFTKEKSNDSVTLTRSDDFVFPTNKLVKEPYRSPFSKFLNGILEGPTRAEGKDCFRCGGAGSMRGEAGTCWACHGSGKQ